MSGTTAITDSLGTTGEWFTLQQFCMIVRNFLVDLMPLLEINPRDGT